MARPDPALLDPANYPWHCLIETRYGDLDMNQHVNNVALAELLEDARVRFLAASRLDAATAEMDGMVAHFAIDYLAQSHYPEPLEIHVGATNLGRTSYHQVQLVRQGGRNVAFARSVLVCVNDQGAVPMPPAFLDAVQQWLVAV